MILRNNISTQNKQKEHENKCERDSVCVSAYN